MVYIVVIAIVAALGLGGFFYHWNQQISEIKIACDQTFKQIEALMKSRYPVLDELAIAVRGFTRKELRTIERVKRTLELAMAETTGPVNQSHTENNLIKAVNMLQEAAPQYANLMASPHFRNLQQQIMALEAKIRQFVTAYNNLIKQHNALLEGFPGSIFAPLSGTKPLPYFILDPVNPVGTPVQNKDVRSESQP